MRSEKDMLICTNEKRTPEPVNGKDRGKIPESKTIALGNTLLLVDV